MDAIKRFVAYWTRLEWHGSRFYLERSIHILHDVWNDDDLRAVRLSIAAFSLGIGAYFVAPMDTFAAVGYSYLRQWVSEGVFGAAFMLHGAGMLWRVLAVGRSRTWLWIFAALGIWLFVSYPLALWFSLGRLPGLAIPMFLIAAGNVWVARRVGRGQDRSGP